MNIERFYSFDDIKANVSCQDVARDLYGCVIKNDYTACLWRGGDCPTNGHVETKKWHDFKMKVGGGVFELMAFKFPNRQEAQQWAGDTYHLTLKAKTVSAPRGPSRYDTLLSEGYIEKSRYEYKAIDGSIRHVTIRLEHPDRSGKEFVQGVPDDKGGIRFGLKNVETLLFRLPEIATSDWVMVCEGEKSALFLAAIGLPATTAPMGAGKWNDSYTDALKGKHVALAADNDLPGREHAETVAAALHGKAASVKVIPPQLPDIPKSGIDDWVVAGNRTAADVTALIAATPVWRSPSILATSNNGCEEVPAELLADAKQANTEPFRNFIPGKTTKTDKKGKLVEEDTKEPRTHDAMLKDLSRRFLGFPRRIGDRCLFDHDRDDGCVFYMDKAVGLKAWIGRKSKKNPEFAQGCSLASETEFFESVCATSKKYESISIVPEWPTRPEVYYAHDKLPPPSPTREYLEKFVNFFLPATEYDKHLIRAFVCAPLWYVHAVPRPLWVFDSKTAQGSGKSTVAYMVASLYGAPHLSVDAEEFEIKYDQTKKRCLSTTGRALKVLIVDNVEGTFKSPSFASMISDHYITGMAPYGHGEESRPNNLTYVVTCNSGHLDNDLIDRCLYVYVQKPTTEQKTDWEITITDYIKHYRLNIISDIIDMLKNHKKQPLPELTHGSIRFTDFARTILAPCCGDQETFADVLNHAIGARSESNADEELAKSINDQIEYQLSKLNIDPKSPTFLTSQVCNAWGRKAIQESSQDSGPQNDKIAPVQIIRNLAKTGMLKNADADVRRWPLSKTQERHSGVAWNFNESTEQAYVILRHASDGSFYSKLL